MAPTLTSNSFLFSTTPHSWKIQKSSKFIIFAQKGKPSSFPSFGLGKKQEENGSDNQVEESKKPFDVKSLIPVVANKPSFGPQRRKDAGTVFVAGATGQAGVRIAQTLLRKGFTVRAGVPDLGAAQELALLASQYKIISPEESKRFFAIESTYESAESIAKAMGNASKAVVTISPTENGPAKEVTTADALQVIQASNLAGIGHVAIIYDQNSASAIYNNVLGGISSFFSNIFASKSQPLTIDELLQKLVETTVNYTLIKTNLTEDFSEESSYNVVVSAEGSSGAANDFKVSKMQIASLVADLFSNTAVAENKVIEVSTNPSVPSRPVDQLFSAIPGDGRRQAYAEAVAKAKAEEEAINASEKAREAAEAAKKLQEEVSKLSEQEAMASSLAAEAKKKAEAAGTSVENLLNQAKNFSWEDFSSQFGNAIQKPVEEQKVQIAKNFSWEDFSSQFGNAIQKPVEEQKVQIATVRGRAKARNLPAKKAVIKQVSPKYARKSNPEPTESKKEVRNVFGGLFKQETIYIDDD
ncbi:Plastid transcriptionally active 16 protein [Thalictrum thalictroides]|uniref:Plastid transcriptionally active 16 protein n=1 Tax=Thalictrum thalictroides TaxID=46969 RepID=A0A7J6WFY5_THATH|nr:Plastid transcriptionally active 16 protein [Thalictrum thalictroides]